MCIHNKLEMLLVQDHTLKTTLVLRKIFVVKLFFGIFYFSPDNPPASHKHHKI